MANFPAYPATSFEQAVDLAIFSSNQLGDVINGDATKDVETENGNIPSVRKALIENFYFKTPVDWKSGSSETVFNQLRFFSNGILSAYYYAPKATSSSPVPMGTTPQGDANWVLYAVQQQQVPSELFPWLLETATGDETVISPPYIFDTAIVTINGVVQVPEVAYTITDSKINLIEPLGVDPETGRPNLFFAYLGKAKQAVADYVQSTVLASNIGAGLIGEMASATALRTLLPTKTAQKVVVKGYTSGSMIGGGTFYYQADSVTEDDGGTFFRVNTTGGWKRQVQDKNTLDVTHFGAVPGGTVDCSAAALAMHNWSTKDGNSIGIRFPAGKFLVNGLDISANYISKFKITGGMVSFGYFPSTTIVSDRKTGKMFKVNARYVEITNLVVDGETNTTANKKGFFENTCVAGQFFRGSNFNFRYLGGRALSLVDTLDCKIDQFYSSNCEASVIYSTWSNTNQGGWNHSTAIELTNFNLQYSKGDEPAIDLQRCTQSFIKNGWIEHTNNAANFANGQWLIEGLSLEGCVVPINMTFSRVIMRQMNLQAGSTITYSDPATVKWLQAYELGRAQHEAYGFRQSGSVSYDYLHSQLRFRNQSDAPVWIHVGRYTVTGDNDETKICFTGGHGESTSDAALGTYSSNNFGGGTLQMTLRRGPGSGVKQDGSVTVTGSSPIQDIRVWRPYERDIEIYVQLKPNCGWINTHLETTADSRFTAGICFLWTPDGTIISNEDIAALNLYTPRKTASWGTLGAGIVVMEDGTFHFQGKALVGGKMPVNINGKNYLLPLEQYPYMSDGFMRQGAIAGTTNDNYLGGTFKNTWGVVGVSDGGAVTNNGSLTISNKGAGAIAMGIQQTDYDIRFKLVSGPANTTGDVQTTFDFRRPTGNTGVDGYRVAFMSKDSSGLNTLRLYKRVSGTSSVISPSDATIMDGQTLRIVIKGQDIQVYADSALLWSITDPSITGGRVVGFGTGASNAGITVSDFEMYTF